MAKCPICAKDAVAAFRPFCSARCADVDLGRWLGGNYRIASEDADEQKEALQEMDALIESQLNATKH
ncbi:zinc-binding protein [Ketogulonicigenium robustum]|uniref:DNA gyrase inhibitor YacG n=1 Tax=Ketogulonicigenium robustum TaxID=92947 RepID=A0A1W6P0H9_9RHOB|nr:DNA gyrase inhibitor YacG [Ketogulonicigenium robustum]ARO15008.1 zinc-binding protein [Ketogulonicigenium robustum]